jgi:hypothetical protein
MADGRAFTDYRPRCAATAELLGAVGHAGQRGTSYESRMYLQRNALAWMGAERQRALERLAPCAPCQRPADTAGTMLPERYVVRCDAAVCTREEINPYGVGDGRDY